MVCPSELGDGLVTKRRFCDVLTGLEPKAGIVVTVPPHQGTVTLSFELHNRHTYSAELVKKKQAYRHYTATVGVLLADLTLIDRAVIDSEFRSEKDLYDRIGGGRRTRRDEGGGAGRRRVRADDPAAGHDRGEHSRARSSPKCGPMAPASSPRPAGRWRPSAT